jgi:hypothetical protein
VSEPIGDRSSRNRWAAFALGGLGGVFGGVALLSWAGIQALGVIVIGIGILLRPRPFGAAGVLTGWGVVTLLLLAGARARCDPASCGAPDVTGWVLMAFGVVVLGVAALTVGLRRST